jgi:ComF family protein
MKVLELIIMIPRTWQEVSGSLCTSLVRPNHFYLVDYQYHQKLVIKTKYSLNLTAVNQITNLIADDLNVQIQELYPLEQNWTITPVPLYWLSRLKRQFCLNSIICKKVAHRCGLNFAKLLSNTSPQTQGQCRDRASRIKNAQHKFKLRRQIKVPRNIIIFDDVVATGSTMKTCEKLLRQKGAKNIIWLSLAH